jgi:tRNA modification GTPase
LWVTDVSTPLSDGDRDLAGRLDPGRTLVIANKIDLAEVSRPQDLLPEAPCVRLSCLTGEGIASLEAELVRLVERDSTSMAGHASAATVRHQALFAEALQAVRRAEVGLGQGATPDLLAVDLGEAVYLLGQVTGETASEELLDTIFAQFCIGK